jgi:hypothetical protein
VLLSFYWHFVRPVWPVFALILFFDLLAAISEVLLATFVAQSIDIMKSAATAASFFSDHPGVCTEKLKPGVVVMESAEDGGTI